MQEKDIINKIEELKQIKPNHNWVVSAKQDILDKKPSFSFDFIFGKSAVTAFASLGLIVVLTVAAQGTTPGDPLFSIKKITEKGQMALVSQEDKQDFNVILTHKRLDEISTIVKRNEIERLSVAVKELETAKDKIQKEFAHSIESKDQKQVIEIARNLAPTVLEIEDKEELLIGSLGVKADNNLPSGVAKDLASLLIKDLEDRSLTESEEKILQEAKINFNEENYRTALRNVLEIGHREDKPEVQENKQE